VDVSTEEEGFAVLQVDISLGDLRLAGPHALDFPTHEGDAGLEALFDEVVEARFAIDGNRRQFFGGFHSCAKRTAILPIRRWRRPRFCRRISYGSDAAGRKNATSRTQRTGDLYGRANVRLGQ